MVGFTAKSAMTATFCGMLTPGWMSFCRRLQLVFRFNRPDFIITKDVPIRKGGSSVMFGHDVVVW